MEVNRMLPIRRNRRVSTATVGVIGLAVLHLAAATGAAAPFGGHRRPRPEYVVLSAGDDRIRSASRVTAPGVGWTAERHPYLRNGTQQRIRLQGSSRSISSFARRDTAGSSRDFRKRKSRVALLLLLRGGSEGLKREAYDPRKAAEPSGSVRSSQGPLFPATPPKRHDDYKCGDADKAEGLRHLGGSASPPAIDPSMLSATAEMRARGASPTLPQVLVAPYEGALSNGAGLGVGQPGSIFDAPPASKSGPAGGLMDRREAIRAISAGAADDISVTDYGSAAGDRRAASCLVEAVAGHEATSTQGNGETCRRRDAGSGAVPPSEAGDRPGWESRGSAPTSSLEASGAAAANREGSPGEGGGFSAGSATDTLSPAGLGASQAPGGAGSFLPESGLDSNDCSDRPRPGEAVLPEVPMPGDAEPLIETGAAGKGVFSSSSSALEVSSRGLAGAAGQALAVPKQKLEQQQQQLAPVGKTGSPLRQRKWKWKPKYLAVKAVFFLFYSSLGAIMPYLPVYYHSLALPDRQIGHIGAITPAMTFLFTPLWGALTDRSGMLKQILVATFLVSTLLRVSLAARTSFAWIMSVIALTAIVNAPVRPLLDSSALQTLDDRGEYGKQRLWGQWGFGIGSFLTGRLLSRFGFKAAFYMHAAFSIPTLLILLRFTPRKEDRTKAPPRFGELYRLMVHDPDVTAFFSMVFAIGLSSGVIENFAYKRLRELGASGSVLGISRLVSSLAGIPMFFFSGRIVKNFSIVTILTAAMISYIARFVIYASIKNPWAGLPAEALRGVTFAGFWAASTCHVGEIAPPGLSTTMLGLLNATYGGIGQSLGSLIGGSLSARFGTARAFIVYAGVDGLLLLAFFSFWGVRLSAHGGARPGGNGEGSSSQGGGGTTPPLSPAATTATAPPFPWREETSLERAHAPSSHSISR